MNLGTGMSLAETVFAQLERDWRGEEDGIHRPAYSIEESRAIDTVRVFAQRMGMAAYADLAGNAYFILPGQDRSLPAVMISSHLDAVPRGGRYDGPAGIVGGLAAIHALRQGGVCLPHDVCLGVWRCEESPWFNQFAVGSKLATGQLGADFLETAKNRAAGMPIRHSMDAIGLDSGALGRALDSGRSLLPLERVAFNIEAHIEQGSVLQDTDSDLGIVTAIRGNLRVPLQVNFHGQAGHSGSVPQDRRRDANLAAAHFMVAVDQAMKGMMRAGADVVWAFPELRGGNSATTIPSLCSVRPEVRSTSPQVLEKARAAILDLAAKVSDNLNLACSLSETDILITDPAIMDESVDELLRGAALKSGVAFRFMPSGAGHDAGVLAQAGVRSGMIFIRHGNGGISHDPREIMADADGMNPFAEDGNFRPAVDVMTRAVADASLTVSGARSDKTFEQHLIARGARVLAPL